MVTIDLIVITIFETMIGVRGEVYVNMTNDIFVLRRSRHSPLSLGIIRTKNLVCDRGAR
uniref:Uncharacterized protein n=1 Tax=Rhizophagus irregularis (strain DAOM 181602 / DAOM 197198 / MUCL 43194) TaxID=747089 RepID=U9TZT0_RHIID